MAFAFNLTQGKRAERKTLITIARWKDLGSENPLATDAPGTGIHTEILGTRTEDSSIEFNADIETTTDIRGITYSDINKTEPQQDFDPYYILGGSTLGEFMHRNALKNNITAYSGTFNIYVVTMYDSDNTKYYTVKHEACSIIPTSIGGDSYVNMPLEVHFSNKITEGYITSSTGTIDENFSFAS